MIFWFYDLICHYHKFYFIASCPACYLEILITRTIRIFINILHHILNGSIVNLCSVNLYRFDLVNCCCNSYRAIWRWRPVTMCVVTLWF